MKKTELSIIVINYNTKDVTRDCLKSVISSINNLSYEIILVDNASTDGSLQSLRQEFPQIIFVCNTQNFGFSKANNQAAKIARGQFLLFLNSDTIVKSQAINLLLKRLKENDYGAIGPRLVDAQGNVQLMCARKFPSLSGTFFNMFLLERVFPTSRIFGKNLMGYWDHSNCREVDSLSGACIMVSAYIFKGIDGFDENYIFYSEDIDLCFKIHMMGKKIFYCGDTEIIHLGKGSTERIGKGSKFYEIVNFYSQRMFFKKNYGVIMFPLFNLISISASIFRILLILLVGPFLGFRTNSDYSIYNIYKYYNILLLSAGLSGFDKIETVFKNKNSLKK